MRLRIFDLSTPWFWFVAFYRKECGDPHISINVYGPNRWSKGWFHLWKWEDLPDTRPQVALMPPDPMNTKDAAVMDA